MSRHFEGFSKKFARIFPEFWENNRMLVERFLNNVAVSHWYPVEAWVALPSGGAACCAPTRWHGFRASASHCNDILESPH